MPLYQCFHHKHWLRPTIHCQGQCDLQRHYAQHWYEWVELYNPSQESISINGWILQASDLQIPLSGVLGPGEYCRVGSSSKIPNLDVNYANLIGKFANTGQKVLLKDKTKNYS